MSLLEHVRDHHPGDMPLWTHTGSRWDLAGLAQVSEAGVGERAGVIVVAPAGALPDPLPACLAEGLDALLADRPAIVDLSGVILRSAAPVVGLVGWAAGAGRQPDRCCVVCASATGRARLRSWYVTQCLAVFGSVGDALQARRFAQEGYGTGWLPDPVSPATLRTTPSQNGSENPAAKP